MLTLSLVGFPKTGEKNFVDFAVDIRNSRGTETTRYTLQKKVIVLRNLGLKCYLNEIERIWRSNNLYLNINFKEINLNVILPGNLREFNVKLFYSVSFYLLAYLQCREGVESNQLLHSKSFTLGQTAMFQGIYCIIKLYLSKMNLSSKISGDFVC